MSRQANRLACSGRVKQCCRSVATSAAQLGGDAPPLRAIVLPRRMVTRQGNNRSRVAHDPIGARGATVASPIPPGGGAVAMHPFSVGSPLGHPTKGKVGFLLSYLNRHHRAERGHVRTGIAPRIHGAIYFNAARPPRSGPQALCCLINTVQRASRGDARGKFVARQARYLGSPC